MQESKGLETTGDGSIFLLEPSPLFYFSAPPLFL